MFLKFYFPENTCLQSMKIHFKSVLHVHIMSQEINNLNCVKVNLPRSNQYDVFRLIGEINWTLPEQALKLLKMEGTTRASVHY